MYFKDKAIVLGKKDAGEASNFYIIYTEKKGLLKATARGAKKSLSKMSGHLEPPCLCEIFFVNGKKVNYIAGASLIHRYELGTLEKHKVHFDALKVFSSLVREGDVDFDLWRVVTDFYHYLENVQEDKLPLLKNIYLWSLGSALGFEMDVEKCLECKFDLGENNYLVFSPGGFFCQSCFKKQKEKGVLVSKEFIKILRFIKRNDIGGLLKLKISDEVSGEFDRLSGQYWSYRFEMELTTGAVPI
ncbi:MAG TPA: DNA repair protein RecO [Candidatus Bipolaricaulota bacterium]|nr:DNA repair protein RecO [Candidatus Bipolaricaulota bacterium]